MDNTYGEHVRLSAHARRTFTPLHRYGKQGQVLNMFKIRTGWRTSVVRLHYSTGMANMFTIPVLRCKP
jgi:hypothetical protein